MNIITVTWENISKLLQIFYSHFNDMKTRTVYPKQWHNSVYKQELAQPVLPNAANKNLDISEYNYSYELHYPSKATFRTFLFKFLHVQKATHNVSTDDVGKKFLHCIQVNMLHITLQSITSQMKANFMVPSMVMLKLSLHTPWKPYRGQKRYSSTHS